MKTLQLLLKEEVEHFSVKNNVLHYQGHPVYEMFEETTLFKAWFASPNGDSATDMEERLEYSYMPPGGYGRIRIEPVDSQEIEAVRAGIINAVPIIKQFSENQLKRVSETLTRLNQRCRRLNPKADFDVM